MTTPEKREQIGVRTDLGIELDPDNLNVVGGSGAYQVVIRIGYVTLRVSDLSLHHSSHSLKRQLHSPETPGSELCELVGGIVRTIRIRLQSRVVFGSATRLLRTGRHFS